MLDGTHYFECQCGADEHLMRITIDKDPHDPGIYAHFFLDSYRPWHQRLWDATKYVFGYRCKYGHFGEWILRDEDAERLKVLLEDYLNR